MSGSPTGSALIAGLARLLLLLYPASFRRSHGAEFVDAARHRWAKERAGGARFPALRTSALLIGDTGAAAPAAWRYCRREGVVSGLRSGVDGLRADARFALRILTKHPGFTAVAVLSLAIGIGANTAMYGVVRFALLDPLAVENPEQLRFAFWRGPEGMQTSQNNSSSAVDPASGLRLQSNYSYDGYRALRAAARGGEVCAFNFIRQLGVSVDGRAASSAAALMVSGNWFDVVRPGLVLGRGITDADDTLAAAPVAVVTHGFWTRALGADPDVIGKRASIDDSTFTIVGVTAAGFRGVSTSGTFTPLTDIIVPLSAQPLVWGRGDGFWFDEPDRLWLRVLTRVSDEVGDSALATPLATAWRGALGEAGLVADEDLAEVHVSLLPGNRGVDTLSTRAERPLAILSAVVALVLLIACVNIAGLMLARGVAREAEVSVRRALGAGRLRLMRQLLVESLLLALAGGAAGVVLAHWAMPVVNAMVATGFDAHAPVISLDLRSLGVAMAVSCLASVLFGTLPALRLTSPDLGNDLRNRSAGAGVPRQTFGRVLLAAQIGISVPLVVGAGLLAHTAYDLDNVNIGFDAGNLVLFSIESGSSVDSDQRAALLARLLERLEATPGVTSATAMENVLLGGYVSNNGVEINGERSLIYMNGVGPGFFATMDMPLVTGRPIDARDTSAAPPVVVINETAARMYFGGDSPLGRRIRYARTDAEVVGVVRDSKYRSVRGDVVPTLFDSYQQRGGGWVSNFAVRTAVPVAGLEGQIRDAVGAVSRDLPVADLRTQHDVLSRSIGREQLMTRLLAAFGGFALVLACLGVYGVTSFAVARSTCEIGVRMALGAERHHVLWMVLRRVLRIAAAGLVLGVPAALAATPVLESVLYGVGPRDLATLVGATLAVLAVALVAGLLPARRAARLDPLDALRSE